MQRRQREQCTMLRSAILDLMDWRRQLMTGTFTLDHLKDLRLRITSHIDWGNRYVSFHFFLQKKKHHFSRNPQRKTKRKKKKTQKKHIGQWWNCVGFQDRGSLWAYIAGPVKGPLSLSWQFPNKFVSLCCRFFCFVVVKEEKKKKPPSSPCCPHSVDKVI